MSLENTNTLDLAVANPYPTLDVNIKDFVFYDRQRGMATHELVRVDKVNPYKYEVYFGGNFIGNLVGNKNDEGRLRWYVSADILKDYTRYKSMDFAANKLINTYLNSIYPNRNPQGAATNLVTANPNPTPMNNPTIPQPAHVVINQSKEDLELELKAQREYEANKEGRDALLKEFQEKQNKIVNINTPEFNLDLNSNPDGLDVTPKTIESLTLVNSIDVLSSINELRNEAINEGVEVDKCNLDEDSKKN